MMPFQTPSICATGYPGGVTVQNVSVSLVTFRDARHSHPRYEMDCCASTCALTLADMVFAVYLLYKKDVRPSCKLNDSHFSSNFLSPLFPISIATTFSYLRYICTHTFTTEFDLFHLYPLDRMNHSTSQKRSQNVLTSKSAADANLRNTGAYDGDTSDAGIHEPFPFLAKPFDYPKYGGSVATDGIAPSAGQKAVGAKIALSGDDKKDSTPHSILRPWATIPAQACTKPAAHPTRANEHSDPLLRWQVESMAQGPYHVIASVSGMQQSTLESWSRKEQQRMRDTPSHVSASRGSSGGSRK
jgi:hypothetical protein